MLWAGFFMDNLLGFQKFIQKKKIETSFLNKLLEEVSAKWFLNYRL